MSDLEALYIFLNKPVDSEMIHYLVATTTSIIQVPIEESYPSTQTINYPTPPTSPIEYKNNKIPTLYNFITRLIEHSHVQSTTLMTTLIYLNRLKQVIPSNSVGMCTTHHRIFLGSMLLAAKFTNDSSPMNKHWTTYTDGLLTLREVNALEIEMIQYIGWENLRFENKDLIIHLQYFLDPIKRKLKSKNNEILLNQIPSIKSNIQHPIPSLNYSDSPQISHSSTSSSLPSLISASSSTTTVSSYISSSASPRKDSVQSTNSISNSLSPIIYTNDYYNPHHNTQQQFSQPSNPKTTPVSIPLRPLRLKPKSQSHTPSTPINIIPSYTNNLHSLQNSKKSSRLLNLNSSLNNNNNKENLNNSSSLDNYLTIVS